jgi:hypothetical protein
MRIQFFYKKRPWIILSLKPLIRTTPNIAGRDGIPTTATTSIPQWRLCTAAKIPACDYGWIRRVRSVFYWLLGVVLFLFLPSFVSLCRFIMIYALPVRWSPSKILMCNNDIQPTFRTNDRPFWKDSGHSHRGDGPIAAIKSW